MTNKQIGAAFVAMCNGTKEITRIIGRNNLHVHLNMWGGVSLYSYSTPIAVYDGKKVVFNGTYFSASTSKHQSAAYGAYEVPLAIVRNFFGLGYSEQSLLDQAAPLYSYEKKTFTTRNGRNYTRFVLCKQQSLTNATTVELHRYVSEEAAKAESDRLNRLAVAAA